MAKYYSTKTYGNDRGLSCCFRQWRSTHSHCSLLHGYSIGIKLIFESDTLDDRNWVMDFGGLKQFKAWADHMFDHTMLIAEDDPYLDKFKELASIGDCAYYEQGMLNPVWNAICDLRIVPAVGCEMFAKMAYDQMTKLLETGTLSYPVNPSVRVKSVEVFEHLGNSAIYEG